MAESCPLDNDSYNRESDISKQDCTSPSPTETICLESLCSDNIPGTSQLLIKEDVADREEKATFLNELGLGECDENSNDNVDCWEDCLDADYMEEHPFESELADEDDPVNREDTFEAFSITHNNIRVDSLKTYSNKSWKKRKLDVHNGFPCKKILPENQTSSSLFYNRKAHTSNSSSDDSTNFCIDKLKTRALIPTKDNPPPEMADWLTQFQRWSNAERILAIDGLILRCDPSQVRHMMQVIEPQFQRDFISLFPRELALSVLRLLEPCDLLRAAQTCRSWRFLADDNLLWKEKCKQVGIEEIPKRKGSPRSPSNSSSPWKAAFMLHHAIEMNWRSKPIRPPKMLKGHDDHVITCLQFCGNRIVSGSDDNTLKVWSATTGKCLRTLVGHTGGVWSSQMAGTVIISGSTDRTLKVWDSETGVCIHTLYGHTSTVRCMHLHKNKVVSGSRDATLRVWDIETGEFLHVLVGHLAAVRCVQYDGKLVVSGAYDYMVKVWNPEREECLHTLQGHTNRVYSLQFDGVHVVSGSLDTSIRVWEVETGACRHTLMGHQSLTSGMELRNNILVSGNADSTVKVWDIISGQCLQTLSGTYKHQSAVTCLQFNKRFVITSSDDGTVKLWDVRTGEFIRNLVALDSGGSGGVVWRIRASDTKLVCAVGSRNGTEETKLLVLDFDVDAR
ncbi:hypothetical protein PPYR_14411 [Photinus pyralis]|uniref:F-box domain-containing protein n=2 Tax=Photinus pyralis TaxID=7054 RepID=A0A5N4A569_PHOPY|nr:F-box/WD repeat-containing protein 7-like [Photinus pyralis]KAB0792452.1 hypothetical protein PPYR_14411 [Photinus pyralis]